MVGSNPDKNYAEQCRYYARTAYDCAKYLFAKASAPVRYSLCWIRCRCSRENINAASTVVVAAEKQFFGDMNSDAYNYDRQERRPSGPVEIGK